MLTGKKIRKYILVSTFLTQVISLDLRADYIKIEEELRAIFRKNPHTPPCYPQEEEKERQKELLQELQQEFKPLCKAGNLDALTTLAYWETHIQGPDVGLAKFKPLAEKKFPPAMYFMSKLLIELKKEKEGFSWIYEAALQKYGHAVESLMASRSPYAKYKLAKLKLVGEKPRSAFVLLSSLVKDPTLKRKVQYRMAQVYEAQENYPLALRAYLGSQHKKSNEAIKTLLQDPYRAFVCLKEGLIPEYYRTETRQLLIKHAMENEKFKELVKAAPLAVEFLRPSSGDRKSAFHFLSQGFVEELKGNFVEALSNYDHAIELKSTEALSRREKLFMNPNALLILLNKDVNLVQDMENPHALLMLLKKGLLNEQEEKKQKPFSFLLQKKS